MHEYNGSSSTGVLCEINRNNIGKLVVEMQNLEKMHEK